jgi:hypothetical protein
MRIAALILSLIGLGLTLVPSFLLFGGMVSWETHSQLMFAGMLCWFATAPFWMKERRS